MVCLGRPYYFNFFIGCLPQILLGSFLNTLTQMTLMKMMKVTLGIDFKKSWSIHIMSLLSF